MEDKKEVAKQTKQLTPIPVKVLEDSDDLRLFACPNCGKVHFRHAGYLEPQTVYANPDKDELKVMTDSKPVKLCVNCKHAYINVESITYDVTKFIDLNAWEKTEKEAHKATGPGGQC